MNKDEQDSNEFKKVIQNNRFKEIFKEAHFQKNKRADCKRIMKLCESVNKDTSSTLKNMKPLACDFGSCSNCVDCALELWGCPRVCSALPSKHIATQEHPIVSALRMVLMKITKFDHTLQFRHLKCKAGIKGAKP